MASPFSYFAAVALSVIDTSSSNFFAENWTQFPYLEEELPGTSNTGKPILESSSEHAEKKVNNAAVTVNSNKLSSNPTPSNGGSIAATSALVSSATWGPKWIANLTDVIGISNQVIKDQTKRKQITCVCVNYII